MKSNYAIILFYVIFAFITVYITAEDSNGALEMKKANPEKDGKSMLKYIILAIYIF